MLAGAALLGSPGLAGRSWSQTPAQVPGTTTTTTTTPTAPVPAVPVPSQAAPVAATQPAPPPVLSPADSSGVQIDQKSNASQTNGPGEASPFNVADTPVTQVIQLLAQSMDPPINVQIDARLLGPTIGPDGRTNGVHRVSIAWPNITAFDALQQVVEGEGWQMTQNQKTRVYRISLRDAPGQEPLFTAIFQLKYANATNLVPILKATVSATRSQVIPDIRTGKIIAVATQAELERLKEYVVQLDTPSSQVLIEARFLETTANPTSVKGIDWTGTLNAQNVSFGNGLTSGNSVSSTSPGVGASSTTPGGRTITSGGGPVTTTSSTLTTTIPGLSTAPGGLSLNTSSFFSPATAFLNADGLSAVLSFLNTDADTESLATPRAVAMDGIPTTLSVVRNIPVFVQSQGANVAGSVQPNTIQPNYELKSGTTILNEVGIKLVVTPRVVGGTNVQMVMEPEISAQELIPASTTLGGQVSTAPIFSRRKLTTTAVIPSGYTLVLGGLINNSANNSFTKVPFLGDIPLFGNAFRHDSKAVNKDNLMIFVTPTIVEMEDYRPNREARSFLRTKPVLNMDMEPGALDSGKPYDWTQPK
jgi:type II secretory pathway component GspD/PulD (secretin)